MKKYLYQLSEIVVWNLFYLMLLVYGGEMSKEWKVI